VPGAPKSSLPFPDALKPRKSKPVNGKPQTMATIPATTECHFTKPNTKSTTAQIEKKAMGAGRFISLALCSTLHNLGDSNRQRLERVGNSDIKIVDPKAHGIGFLYPPKD
jgi:hypothetical protein